MECCWSVAGDVGRHLASEGNRTVIRTVRIMCDRDPCRMYIRRYDEGYARAAAPPPNDWWVNFDFIKIPGTRVTALLACTNGGLVSDAQGHSATCIAMCLLDYYCEGAFRISL